TRCSTPSVRRSPSAPPRTWRPRARRRPRCWWRRRRSMPEGLPRISMSTSSTRDNRTGSWKYVQPAHRDGVAPCNTRCPAGVDVEGWLNLVREGRLDEAQDLLLRENPLPAVTGRVCDHPCEAGCNRASFDEPVAVH